MMTTIIKDLKENSDFAARQYQIYKKAVSRIGDTNSLREANEGLGYNLVKTIPGLLERIKELEGENFRLQKRQPAKRVTSKVEPDDRPLGIPEDHIVLNVSDSLELEVVTEEAPGHSRGGEQHDGAGEDCPICWPDGSEANEPNPTPGQMPRGEPEDEDRFDGDYLDDKLDTVLNRLSDYVPE